MNFSSAAKKNIFPSLDKSFSIQSRKSLFQQNQKYLLLLKEEIEDKFDNVHMFVINDFLDESKFDIRSIDVLIEMTYREFDSFVDSGMLFEFYSDNINYFFSVGDMIFSYDKEQKNFTKAQLEIENKATI